MDDIVVGRCIVVDLEAVPYITYISIFVCSIAQRVRVRNNRMRAVACESLLQ